MTDMPTLEEFQLATDSYDYYLGSGMDRHGYHIPGSRWVYKVAKNPDMRINEAEYRRYQELLQQGLPEGIAIPEMHLLHNGAIAAEFIAGERPESRCDYTHENDSHYADYAVCWYNWVEAFSAQTGLWDSSALCNMRLIRDDLGNVVKVYMIDLGE